MFSQPYPGDVSALEADEPHLTKDPPDVGMWRQTYCGSTANVALPFWRGTNNGGASEVDDVVVTAPTPVPRMSPAPDRLVVAMKTWMWLEASSFEPRADKATISTGEAIVSLTPRSVSWEMGNGDRVVCFGAGTPYDPSKPDSAQSTPCSYTFTRSSAGQPNNAFTVRVTSEWNAWISAPAAGVNQSLGIVTASTTLQARVGEVQAINTGS